MKKVLVIVAHPDDETIWMGGTLLRHKKDWDVSIISLCRKDDSDRAPKFKKVCQVYNAKCFMSNLEDEKLNPIDLNEVIERIKNFANNDYDYIFTHGENGEYGHKRHKDVHKAVIEMLRKKLIRYDKLFCFSYIKKGEDSYSNPNATKFIKLNNFELIEKKNLIQDIYGFEKGGFEERNCRDVESFDENEMFSILSLSG